MTSSAQRKAGAYRAPSTLARAEIEAAMADGLTSYQAAQRLGCRRLGLLRQCRRLGLRWPYDPAKNARKVVYARGAWWSLAEVARAVGASRERIRRRWVQGDRGERLFRPVRRYAPGEIKVGLSEHEWRLVIDTARHSGVTRTAQKFGVPRKAVQAALNGEWWRLA